MFLSQYVYRYGLKASSELNLVCATLSLLSYNPSSDSHVFVSSLSEPSVTLRSYNRTSPARSAPYGAALLSNVVIVLCVWHVEATGTVTV